MRSVFFVRMTGDGAQPERIIRHLPQIVVIEEIDRRVDDRALAVMFFQRLQENAHFLAHNGCVGAQLAGWRLRVPFHVENGRKRAGVTRYVLNIPARLLDRRTAEIIEMIGAPGDACLTGAVPMFLKAVIDPVAAFGRLDEGKGNATGANGAPVNIGLVFGNVRAVDRIVPRRLAGPVVRVAIPETGRLHRA